MIDRNGEIVSRVQGRCEAKDGGVVGHQCLLPSGHAGHHTWFVAASQFAESATPLPPNVRRAAVRVREELTKAEENNYLRDAWYAYMARWDVTALLEFAEAHL